MHCSVVFDFLQLQTPKGAVNRSLNWSLPADFKNDTHTPPPGPNGTTCFFIERHLHKTKKRKKSQFAPHWRIVAVPKRYVTLTRTFNVIPEPTILFA